VRTIGDIWDITLTTAKWCHFVAFRYLDRRAAAQETVKVLMPWVRGVALHDYVRSRLDLVISRKAIFRTYMLGKCVCLHLSVITKELLVL
jgi:hypothetical protein